MELQHIVGAPCVHCKERILVDIDGKNCSGCGLAVHRRHAKAHRAECTNKPMVTRVAQDYDEVAPLTMTPRLVTFLSIGAFLIAMSGAWLINGPEASSSQLAQAPSGSRAALTWIAMGLGLLSLVGGYLYERSRQRTATPNS